MVNLPEARAALKAAMVAKVPFVLVDREWLENALTELERGRAKNGIEGIDFGHIGARS